MQRSKPITIRGEPIPAWFVDERGHRDERESWLSLVEKEGLRSHNSMMAKSFSESPSEVLMSEIIADAMRQYMVGSITTGADLLQIRHMVGLDQITFAKLIGKSTSAIMRAEDSNVLPRDIALLAKGVMIEHMSNLALQHMREMQISPQDRAVIARVFCTRMANELRVECAA